MKNMQPSYWNRFLRKHLIRAFTKIGMQLTEGWNTVHLM